MFTPIRFTPPPIPLAVSPGLVTACATPVPTWASEVPAAFTNTSVLLTSLSAARAFTSSMRVATCDMPSASKLPKVESTMNTWYGPGVSTFSLTV